jgi:hypothetical protein
VLIQLGKQQAPSLWPVGFRSALHAWRPVVTAVNRHALIAGYALPGEKVTVSIQRGGRAPAAAETTTDPQSGGFVAMLHDSNGNPVPVRPGDMVQVQSGGREASVTVSAFAVHAHARSLTGRSRPGSTIPITVVPSGRAAVEQVMSTADSTGHFRARLPKPLQAGSLVIASSVDAGGDEESAAGYVPGMTIDLAESSVTGWLGDRNPTLQVWRHGREIYSRPLNPAADGSFRMAMQAAGEPLALHPGDAVSIGSEWHRIRAVVPTLGLTLNPGSSTIQLLGPPHYSVNVHWNRPADPWGRDVPTDASGRASTHISGPRIAVGDSASIQIRLPDGDAFVTSQRVRGVVIRENTGRVTGETASGSAVHIRVLSSTGQLIARDRLRSDPVTGSFAARVTDSRGRRLLIQPGMVLQISDASGSIAVRMPQIGVTVDRSAHRVEIDAPGSAEASVVWTSVGLPQQRRLRLNAAGLATAPLPRGASAATVSVGTRGAVVVERTVPISSGGRTGRR